MRALLLLGLVVVLLVAGCSTPPAPGNTTNDSSGRFYGDQGSSAFGNDTFGNGTGSGRVSTPATGNGTLDWHNPGNPVVVWTVSNGTFSGTFKAELFLDRAPLTAGNFFNLTRSGFYDGTRFHRVIANFMIQDGDPLTKDPAQRARWGTGGSDDIRDEFPCKDGSVSHEHADLRGVMPCTGKGGLLFTHAGKGLLSMANGGPNTGSSQYFVTVAATPWLDGKHPVFGRVIEGYEVVEALSKVSTTGSRAGDRPLQDILISSLRVEGA